MASCAPPCIEEGEKEVAYENHDVHSIYRRWDSLVQPKDVPKMEAMVFSLAKSPPATEREYQKCLQRLRKEHRIVPRKAQLFHIYQRLVSTGRLSPDGDLRDALVTKASKSQSGIISITVLTSPYPRVGEEVQEFSCQWNCHYLPGSSWTAALIPARRTRGEEGHQNQFDPVLQFSDRYMHKRFGLLGDGL